MTDERRREALAQDALIRSAVYDEAMRRGVDASAAASLIDRSRLVLDERGQPLNVMEQMDVLLEQRPYLSGSAHVRPRPPAGPVRGFAAMEARLRRLGKL